MSDRETRACLAKRPFRLFLIRVNSGRTYDVRHPEIVQVGRHSMAVYSSVGDSPDVLDRWETISLLLIEAVSHLDVPE